MHCYAKKCKDAIEYAENLQIKRGIKSNTGMTRKILTFYMGNIAVTVVGCLVYGTYKHGFPSRVSYPNLDVDMKTAPVNHCIMWVLQAFTCFYAGAGNAGPDGAMMLIISIIVNFGNRLKELLNNIGVNPKDDYIILREAVEMHVIIIELSDKVVKAFRFVLLCQLIFTITHTCIIVFAVTKVDDLGLIMTSLMPILVAAYFQLFVFSYAGEILLNMSEDLRFSAYDNQWYNMSVENRKHLILLVEASKRTLSFESYGIIRACYETCLNVSTIH
ncbi:hypothetical protein O3M35_008449 [Rhynocoris fuscipes]|uniref:Uncharacterized protein n=1 Tax=Rhynocoris fuscipes TaxID=488301 RepID=A0AAW1D7K1_9HEMI